MRTLILLAALLLPATAMAQEWEYKVVSLSLPLDESSAFPKLKQGAVVKEGSYHVVPEMSAALSELGAQGWEVVGVTGNNLATTIFLRRQVD
jgi:hypothetical protein